MGRKRVPAVYLALGGLFCALFFLASNILPPIQIVPGVPVTLQVPVVAMMGGLLGCKLGFTVLTAIFLMTAAGVPMMSGFSGGMAAFVKPTAGYMVGWVFIVLAAGLYRDRLRPWLRSHMQGGRRGGLLQAGAFMLPGAAGVLLCYACGAVWLSIYNGVGLSGFWLGFIGNAVFFPADLIKLAAAYFLCRAAERVLRRLGVGSAV